MSDRRRKFRTEVETDEALRMRGGLRRAGPADVIDAALEAEIAEARRRGGDRSRGLRRRPGFRSAASRGRY